MGFPATVPSQSPRRASSSRRYGQLSLATAKSADDNLDFGAWPDPGEPRRQTVGSATCTAAFAPDTAASPRRSAAGAAGTRSTAAVATVLLIDGRPLMRECLTRGMRAEWPAARLAATGWDQLETVAASEHVDLCLVSLGTGGTSSASGLRSRRRRWSC